MKRAVRNISLLLIFILLNCFIYGCHTDSAQIYDTNTVLYKNGATDYKIVIPEDASETEIYAGNELQSIFQMASGIQIEIIGDKGLSFNKSDKYLSVGNTLIFKGSNMEVTYDELNENGYKIMTYGNTVIMNGYGGNGTLYSVYGFCEQNFGYKYYAKDEIKINKKDAVNLKHIELTDKPSFMGRCLDSYTLYNDNEYFLRMRLTSNKTEKIPGINSFWSTLNDQSMAAQILPYDTYKDRAGWFSGDFDNGQLDVAKAYYDEEMYKEFLDNLINNFIAIETKAKFFMLGTNDNSYTPKSEDYIRDCAKYKSSGIMVRFCNKVASDVRKWINENQPGREFYIVFFAYLSTLEPPTSYDSKTQTFTPLDPSVVADDNVLVRLAPISSHNMHPHNDVDVNPASYTAFNGWKVICKNYTVWDYGTNFNAYLAPYPDWGTISENLNMYYDYGVIDIFTQLPAHTSGTSFYAMMIYVRSQLMWNINLNYNELVEDFIDNYYKEAAPYIKEYYNYLRSCYQIIDDKKIYRGYIYGTDIYGTKCWALENMLQIQKLFKKAYETIEPLKDTYTEKYNLLKTRLNTESLFYRYVIIENFSSSYTVDVLNDMVNSWEQDSYIGKLRSIGREVNSNPTSKDLVTNVIQAWKDKFN